MAALARAVGEVDVLVVAANATSTPQLRELTAESWDRLIDTNLTGKWNVVHAFLQPLPASHGTLILISSVSQLAKRSARPTSRAGVLASREGSASRSRDSCASP